jgi:hypothetical protein
MLLAMACPAASQIGGDPAASEMGEVVAVSGVGGDFLGVGAQHRTDVAEQRCQRAGICLACPQALGEDDLMLAVVGDLDVVARVKSLVILRRRLLGFGLERRLGGANALEPHCLDGDPVRHAVAAPIRTVGAISHIRRLGAGKPGRHLSREPLLGFSMRPYDIALCTLTLA